MGGLSLWHWIVVLLVVLLVFGPSRLGQVGKGLGDGIRSFKKGLEGDEKPPEDPKQLGDGKSRET